MPPIEVSPFRAVRSTKRSRFFPVVALASVVLGWAGQVDAATITAASGNAVDLQAACNQAKPGDVIAIPAGTFTFDRTVTCSTGFSFRGAGESQTVLRSGSVTTAMLYLSGANGLRTEISGITFIGTGNDGSRLDLALHLTDSPKDFRVHHCTIIGFGGYGIYVSGNSRGVVDHCTFKDVHYGTVDSMGYGVCVIGDGAASWSRPLALGTAEAVFVEDNQFSGTRHAVASNAGSRYVFRHNQVRDPPANWVPIDAHGREYGSTTGSRSFEIYENTVANQVGTAWAGSVIRGGDGVIFNNQFGPGINNPIYLANRLDGSETGCSYPCPDQTRALYAWNNTNAGAPIAITVRAGHEPFFMLGRDYFNGPMPGYTPYVYPHPLVGTALPVDAGSPDAGAVDAGRPDAGQPDASVADAGVRDAGSTDAGPVDGGLPDAGPVDAGSGALDGGELAGDAGTPRRDAGTPPDTGDAPSGLADGGGVGGCATTGGPGAGTWLALLAAWLAVRATCSSSPGRRGRSAWPRRPGRWW